MAVVARNVNGADRAREGKEWRARMRERPMGSYNEGIDMLIRDRGVAVCLSVVLDTVTFAHLRARSCAYSCTYSRAHSHAIGHGALQMRSTYVYHAPRYVFHGCNTYQKRAR